MTDRSIAPLVRPLAKIVLPEIGTSQLANGIPVYEIDAGTQQVVKLEFVFNAGRVFEEKKLIGKATVNQLKEGAGNRTGAAIAETLDYFGCTLKTPFNMDTSNIAVFALRKHLPRVLPALRELIVNPTFPEEEIRSYISRNVKKLEVELSKNDVVAYRVVTEKVFGTEHAYGYNSSPGLYRGICREDLVEHHQRAYNAENAKIIVSGKTSGLIDELDKYFGDLPVGRALAPGPGEKSPELPRLIRIKNTGNVQAAIRIGKVLFGRNHSDFFGCYLLSHILGGYFGSRLMTNIREDKGYTYNIYATIDTMAHGGCFHIATEVGNDFIEETLSEIRKEIELLRERLVEPAELNAVKSYIMGNLLTMIDGPLNISEVVKSLLIDRLPLSFFNRLVEHIQGITPEQIRELAQKYLGWETMWKVIVE